MIGEIISGRGFRGLVEYLLAAVDHKGKQREIAEVIGGTIIGTTPREIARQYGALRRLNPSCGVAVAHQIFRCAAEDQGKLSQHQKAEIAEKWCAAMGFDSFTIVDHGTDWHLVASRIRLNGATVDDSFEKRRSERVIRKLRREFGLRELPPSHNLVSANAVNEKGGWTKGQIAYAEVTGCLPPSKKLAEIVDAALVGQPTATEFLNRLEAAGVQPLANVASAGRVNGFAYRIDGTEVRGSAIGAGYSWSNLLKKGLDYVADRDLTAIRARAGTARTAAESVVAGAAPDDGRPGDGDRRAQAAAAGAAPAHTATAGVPLVGAANPRGLSRPRAQGSGSRRNGLEVVNNRRVGKGQLMETAAAINLTGAAPTSAALYGQPTGVWNPRNLAEIEIFAGTGTVKRYCHHDGPPPALSLTTHDGAEVQHVSGAVTTSHATPAAIAAMVGVAHAQGWASVELAGADDFKLAAAEQLMRRGILISNPEMKAALEAIRWRLAQEAEQALAAQVRAQASSITPAHHLANAHQIEIEAYVSARKEAGELWHGSGDTQPFRDAQARRNAAAAALDRAAVIPPEVVNDIDRLRGFVADVLCARGTSRTEAERTAKGLKGAADAALLLGFDQRTETKPTLNQVASVAVAGSGEGAGPEQLQAWASEVLIDRGVSREDAEKWAEFVQEPVHLSNLFGWRWPSDTIRRLELSHQRIQEVAALRRSGGLDIDASEVATPAVLAIEALDRAEAVEAGRLAAKRLAAGEDAQSVLSQQQLIAAHKLAAAVAVDNPTALASYRLVLEADEMGAPWTRQQRESLQELASALDASDADEAETALLSLHEIKFDDGIWLKEFVRTVEDVRDEQRLEHSLS